MAFTTSNKKLEELTGILSNPKIVERLEPICAQNGISAEKLVGIFKQLPRDYNWDAVQAPAIYSALLQCATCGLYPLLSRCYVIPDRNTGLKVTIGYQGLLELGRKCGVRAMAYVVYNGDRFEVSLGFNENVVHVPNLESERGPGNVVYSYCVWSDQSGEKHIEVMNKQELDKVRSCSRSQGGPWEKFYAEMCKKVVVRRASKYWPLNAEVAQAIAKDDKENFDFSKENGNEKQN